MTTQGGVNIYMRYKHALVDRSLNPAMRRGGGRRERGTANNMTQGCVNLYHISRKITHTQKEESPKTTRHPYASRVPSYLPIYYMDDTTHIPWTDFQSRGTPSNKIADPKKAFFGFRPYIAVSKRVVRCRNFMCVAA